MVASSISEPTVRITSRGGIQSKLEPFSQSGVAIDNNTKLAHDVGECVQLNIRLIDTALSARAMHSEHVAIG